MNRDRILNGTFLVGVAVFVTGLATGHLWMLFIATILMVIGVLGF